MRISPLKMRAALLVMVSVAAAPLLSAPAAAESKKSITKQENSLAAAGFVVKPANTPARIDMLNRLPKDKFARRIKGDVVTYVYADPKSCNCLYVGTEAAYGRYQKAVQAKNIADEQEMAAEDYSDPNWNWGAWGGWDGGFGFDRFGW